MNTKAIDTLAQTITDTALQFMATKAGASVADIATAIADDPTGNAARYFGDLVAAAVNNVDSILAGERVTAATIKAVVA